MPFLYHVDGDARVRVVAQLSSLIGMAYFMLAGTQPPFDVPVPFPQTLGLSGKIMAYVAVGSPEPRILAELEALHRRALLDVYGTTDPPRFQQDETTFRALVEQFRAAIADLPEDMLSDDVLAAIHTYLGEHVRRALREAVEADGQVSRNLCLVGGCALNIKWNRSIRESGWFDNVGSPFPNNSGSAIGAACCELLRTRAWLEWDVYAGPHLGDGELNAGWTQMLCSVEQLARLLHDDAQPILYLDGRAELGPRALGHRSILAGHRPADDVAPERDQSSGAVSGRWRQFAWLTGPRRSSSRERLTPICFSITWCGRSGKTASRPCATWMGRRGCRRSTRVRSPGSSPCCQPTNDSPGSRYYATQARTTWGGASSRMSRAPCDGAESLGSGRRERSTSEPESQGRGLPREGGQGRKSALETPQHRRKLGPVQTISSNTSNAGLRPTGSSWSRFS